MNKRNFNQILKSNNSRFKNLEKLTGMFAAIPVSSVTPSITPTISVTPSITPTISVTPSITPTISVTPSITPTISVTPSLTPLIPITPTLEPTPSITPTKSILPSITPTISITPSITPTISITPSITPTISVTPSITPTISVTPSITPTISVTPSITPTISVTPSITPTISITPSITPSVTPSTPTGWTLIEPILTQQPIDLDAGVYTSLKFGHSVSMAPSGCNIIVGAPGIGIPYGPGKSQTLQFAYNTDNGEKLLSWYRTGPPIDSKNPLRGSGWHTDIASTVSGARLAVYTATWTDDAEEIRGVGIYDYSDATEEISEIVFIDTIIGSSQSSGNLIALNKTGDRIIIGYPADDSVRVYDIDTDLKTYVQVGDTISKPNDLFVTAQFGPALFGHAVDISGDGNTIAVGAPNGNWDVNLHNGYNGPYGFVEVYTLSGSEWVKVGERVDGANNSTYVSYTDSNGVRQKRIFNGGGYEFGWSLSLNNTGDKFVAGSPTGNSYNATNNRAGWCGVWELSGTPEAGEWLQAAAGITGANDIGPDSYLGHKVEINDTGNQIVLLSRYNGIVSYELSAGDWLLNGKFNDWPSAGIYDQQSLAMGSDGDAIIIGSPEHNEARVYKRDGTNFDACELTGDQYPDPAIPFLPDVYEFTSCQTAFNSGGPGVRSYTFNELDSWGGIVAVLCTTRGVSDKVEISHNGQKVATSSMAATGNSGPFNTTPVDLKTIDDKNYRESVNQYIGDEIAGEAIPTRLAQFNAETNNSIDIGDWQQIIWWKYDENNYSVNKNAVITVTAPEFSQWEIANICLPIEIDPQEFEILLNYQDCVGNDNLQERIIDLSVPSVTGYAASDNKHPNYFYTYNWTINGVSANDTQSFTYNFNPNSSYEIKCTVTNRMGNVGSNSITSFYIDECLPLPSPTPTPTPYDFISSNTPYIDDPFNLSIQ